MSRLLLIFALVVAAARVAAADPTPAQLEAAKKSFVEGRALHDQGKLAEAVEKFKESYKLSKNPLLLYNIGYTLDELKNTALALVYYRRFLTDAPKDATQRPEVTERVKQLEQEMAQSDLDNAGSAAGSAAPPPATDPGSKPTTPPATNNHEGPFKPAGTYKAEDVQHQVITEAPPGKPLDLSASVPEDSGFSVILYYRSAGEPEFTARPMHWRNRELVGRIPAAKMTGSSIQYYLEVKDQAGNVVARSGKSASPNLVNVDASATPRFYPDITDDGGARGGTHNEDEDPIHGNMGGSVGGSMGDSGTGPVDTVPTGNGGILDPGSQQFKYAKLGTTIGGGALIATAVTFYILASGQANNLVTDSKNCPGGGTAMPPCRQFDSTYDQAVQDAGNRDQLIYRVTLGLGLATSAVAGYFWYREYQAKGHGTTKSAPPPSSSPEMTWIVLPSISDGFAGATAAARF